MEHGLDDASVICEDLSVCGLRGGYDGLPIRVARISPQGEKLLLRSVGQAAGAVGAA